MHNLQPNANNTIYNGIAVSLISCLCLSKHCQLYREPTDIYTSKQLECNGLQAHIQGARLCMCFTVVEMTRSHSVINTRFIRQPRLCVTRYIEPPLAPSSRSLTHPLPAKPNHQKAQLNFMTMHICASHFHLLQRAFINLPFSQRMDFHFSEV